MAELSGRAGLHAKIDELSDAAVDIVCDFVDAMLLPIHSDSLPSTWLTTPTWLDAFVTRLRGHHALSIVPLSTTQFEASFNEACAAAGWSVTAGGSATQRFFVTTITMAGYPAPHLSLNAYAAKDMPAD